MCTVVLWVMGWFVGVLVCWFVVVAVVVVAAAAAAAAVVVAVVVVVVVVAAVDGRVSAADPHRWKASLSWIEPAG